MDDAAWAGLNNPHLRKLATLCPGLGDGLGNGDGAGNIVAEPDAEPADLVEALQAWQTSLAGVKASELSAGQDRDRRILDDFVSLCQFGQEQAETLHRDPDALSVTLALVTDRLQRLDGEGTLQGAVAQLRALKGYCDSVHARVSAPTGLLLGRAQDVAAHAEAYLDRLVEVARARGADQAGSSELGSAVEDAKVAVAAHREWLKELASAGDVFVWGPERFDELCAKLRLPYGAAELRELAEAERNEGRVELNRFARHIDADADAAEIVAKARSAQPASFEDGVSALRSCLDASRAFLEEQRLLQLPEQISVEVTAAPAALTESAPRAGLLTVPCASAAKGLLLVLPPGDASAMTGMSQAELVSLVVREIYPGRHLQRARAKASASAIRSVLPPTMLIPAAAAWSEDLAGGWSSYSAEMMREEGYGATPFEFLVLADELLRGAVRALIDVELHCGTMSVDRAKALLRAELGDDEARARDEVCRIIQAPGRAAAALAGACRLAELRRHAKELWRESFTLARFHDFVLDAGTVPLCYLVESIAGVRFPEQAQENGQGPE